MVKVIRDPKTGEFRGSIGEGKHKIPTTAKPVTKPFITPEELEELASSVRAEYQKFLQGSSMLFNTQAEKAFQEFFTLAKDYPVLYSSRYKWMKDFNYRNKVSPENMTDHGLCFSDGYDDELLSYEELSNIKPFLEAEIQKITSEREAQNSKFRDAKRAQLEAELAKLNQ